MTGRTTRGTDFTRTRADRAPRSHDPLGKESLFSSGTARRGATRIGADDTEGRGATPLFSRSEARPGTLILDCASCNRHTRVTFAEFAALHFPLWLWIPTPTRTHRHWLRCPACQRFAWLRAGWFE